MVLFASGFGVITGFNIVMAKRFHLNIYVGGGIRTSDGNDAETIFDVDYRGIVPRAGLNFGINF